MQPITVTVPAAVVPVVVVVAMIALAAALVLGGSCWRSGGRHRPGRPQRVRVILDPSRRRRRE